MHTSPQHVLYTISLLTCLGALLYAFWPGGPAERRRRRAAAVLLGALYGFGMRLGLSGAIFGPTVGHLFPTALSLAFLVLMPMAVGAIAVYCGDEQQRRSLGYQLSAPLLDICVFLGLTALGMLEGAICIAMALPIFLLMGMAGGVLMGLLLRLFRGRGSVVGCFAALPFLAAPLQNPDGYRTEIREVRLQTTIHAEPAVIFGNIKNVRDIRPEELGSSWVYSIGVPRPQEGLTEVTPQGEVRWSRWSQGVRFRENILAQIPERSILWDFHFDEASIPPGVLDEHVRIGGRYFDLVDTRYDIEPLGGGDCRLSLTAHYRVTTGFNAYAALWAGGMLRAAGGTVLNVYKHRSEADELRLRAAVTPTAQGG